MICLSKDPWASEEFIMLASPDIKVSWIWEMVINQEIWDAAQQSVKEKIEI